VQNLAEDLLSNNFQFKVWKCLAEGKSIFSQYPYEIDFFFAAGLQTNMHLTFQASSVWNSHHYHKYLKNNLLIFNAINSIINDHYIGNEMKRKFTLHEKKNCFEMFWLCCDIFMFAFEAFLCASSAKGIFTTTVAGWLVCLLWLLTVLNIYVECERN
jgi:hypothetical protein